MTTEPFPWVVYLLWMSIGLLNLAVILRIFNIIKEYQVTYPYSWNHMMRRRLAERLARWFCRHFGHIDPLSHLAQFRPYFSRLKDPERLYLIWRDSRRLCLMCQRQIAPLPDKHNPWKEYRPPRYEDVMN